MKLVSHFMIIDISRIPLIISLPASTRASTQALKGNRSLTGFHGPMKMQSSHYPSPIYIQKRYIYYHLPLVTPGAVAQINIALVKMQQADEHIIRRGKGHWQGNPTHYKLQNICLVARDGWSCKDKVPESGHLRNGANTMLMDYNGWKNSSRKASLSGENTQPIVNLRIFL